MRNTSLILWTLITPGIHKGINARLLSSEKKFPKDDPVPLDHDKAQDKEQTERRLVSNDCPAMAPSNTCKKDVFIIGAGMAGVAAARELSLNSGLGFVWAEARSEIGGRMRLSQDALCDGRKCWNLEDGANWVSGAEGNPIFELVWKYDLEHRQMNWGSVSFYDLVGDKKIQKNQLPYGPFESAYNCFTKNAFECKENPQVALDCDLSARAYMKQHCNWDPTDQLTSNNLEKAVEYYTLDWEQARDPDGIGQLGYPLWPYGYDFQSKDFLIEDGDGYKKVAESYVEGNVPCLNTKISKVEWNTGSGSTEYPVRVHAEDGGICDVKTVISTLPASYMLHDSKVNLFSPSPDETLAALAKTYNVNLFYKVFFRFRTMFWDSNDVIFTSGQTVIDGCTVWTNFHRQQRNRYFSGSNILMCTLVTEAVENLTGGTGVLSDTNVHALLDPLRTVYGLDLPVQDYEYHYNPWKTDEYAFGSYEAFKAGALESDFHDATRPLVNDAGDAVVHWAGSHACFRHASWVHGALARGQSVAREVINQLANPSPNLDTTSICTVAPGGGYGNPVFQNARGH